MYTIYTLHNGLDGELGKIQLSVGSKQGDGVDYNNKCNTIAPLK